MDASLYPTNIIAACAPTYPDNPNDDDTVLTVVTNAMQERLYSLAGSTLDRIISQWNRTGITGVKLAGISLTH
jgi:hypothetical protein